MSVLTIRSAVPGDAGRLAQIYSYYVTDTAVSFEYAVPSAAEFAQRIEKTLERYPYLVLEQDGEIAGYAYAGPLKGRAAYDRSCEVSIYLDRGSRRLGYGRALYEALEEKLAEAGFLNMYACVTSAEKEDGYLTKDSELFHLRLGFSVVGEFHKCGYKFGRWYNVVWMEKMIGDRGRDFTEDELR